MGTKEKLVERFKRLPSDFTFQEVERLLQQFGYARWDKGKTSGARVIFSNADHRPIMLHNNKPHPENTMKAYAMKQLLNDLVEAGYIEL